MPDGMRHKIFDALEAQLRAGLTWPKTIAWDRIRLLSSEFGDHEIPVVQFYAIREDIVHQHGKLEAHMQLSIEVCLRQTQFATCDQSTLVDYLEEVEQCVGAQPNFGVPGVIHARYMSVEVDLHTIEPIYYGRLNFDVIYHKPYTGIC